VSNPVVLIVDNDEDFLYIARRALEREHVRADVRFARNGTEALSLLGLVDDHLGPPINLVAVFLDLNMPGVNGLEVLRRVRENACTKDLPVVVVSTSSRSSDLRLSYRYRANSYVVKRFEPAGPGRYLAQAVRYWCELNHVTGRAPTGNDS